jgi:Tol biopolymer transport system component
MKVSLSSLTHAAAVVALAVAASWTQAFAQQAAMRPMTFLDMQQMRQVGSPTPSPDGKWLLYTLSTPDWKEAKRQTDLYVVSMQQGVASTRQLTFTKEKNETSPPSARI